MSPLADQDCVSPHTDQTTLNQDQVAEYMREFPDWEQKTVDGLDQLWRAYSFDDFAKALAFTQAVGELAEEQDHHPEIVTSWGAVTVKWWTHAVEGLHKNDFIMAAKCDRAYAGD